MHAAICLTERTETHERRDTEHERKRSTCLGFFVLFPISHTNARTCASTESLRVAAVVVAGRETRRRRKLTVMIETNERRKENDRAGVPIWLQKQANKQTIITTLHRTENVQPWIRRDIGWNLRRISQTHDRVSEEFPCEWANNWRVRSSWRRSATTTGDCRIPAHVYERREID